MIKKGYYRDELYDFYKTLPPITKINSFDFQKQPKSFVGWALNNPYETSIAFSIFGRTILPEELTEMGIFLGNKCFGDQNILNVATARKHVEERLTYNDNENVQHSSFYASLVEISGIVTEIEEMEKKWSMYDKMIWTIETI